MDTIRLVPSDIIQYISDTVTSQGVVAAFQRPDDLTLNDFKAQLSKNKEPGLIVVTDNVSDPGNMGTIIRTSYGFGVDGIITIAGCDIWSPKVIRSSVATCLSLPIISSTWSDVKDSFFPSVQDTEDAGESSYHVALATAGAGSIIYDRFDYTKPTILVMGSEAVGIDVQAETLSRSTTKVVIPMSRGLESLNVGVASATILGEANRQRRNRTKR